MTTFLRGLFLLDQGRNGNHYNGLRREDLFISSNRIFRKASACGLGRSVGVPAAIRSGASPGKNRRAVRVEGSMATKKIERMKKIIGACNSLDNWDMYGGAITEGSGCDSRG